MLAAFSLGADAVQIGSRFACSKESSAHSKFKESILNAKEGDTILTLKEITPVRLIKNQFYNEIDAMYNANQKIDDIKDHLGRGRAKKGMFEGDLDNGELEIGKSLDI